MELHECDVCGQPATVVRPAIRNREFYCAYDAKLGLGWKDTYRSLGATNSAPLPSKGTGNHVTDVND